MQIIRDHRSIAGVTLGDSALREKDKRSVAGYVYQSMTSERVLIAAVLIYTQITVDGGRFFD